MLGEAYLNQHARSRTADGRPRRLTTRRADVRGDSNAASSRPPGRRPGSWDTSYEWKAVTLLGIGFGLVGLDRWIIASLLPLGMAADLGLSVQDGGNIVGALGLAWGVFAIFSGRISDKIGHRKVLIPAIVLFSLLSGLVGYGLGRSRA